MMGWTPRLRRAGASWPLPHVAVLAALCVATYLCLHTPGRYAAAPVGVASQLAPPPDLRHWERSRRGLDFAARDGVIVARLAARDAGEIAALRASLALPDGIDAVRVSLNVGAEAILAGEEAWQRARVQFLSFDQARRFLWYWPRDIASVSGDRRFSAVSTIVPVKPDLKFAHLLILNGADSGVLRVGPPRVQALTERPVFMGLRYLLVLAWLLAGLWIARTLAHRAASAPRAGLLLVAVSIALGGTLMPQPAFRTLSAPLEAVAVSLADALLRPRAAPAVPAAAPAQTMARQTKPGDTEVPPTAAQTQDAAPLAGDARRAPGGVSKADSATAEPSGRDKSLVRAPTETDYPFSFKQLSHFAVFFLLGLAGAAAFPRAPWASRLACLASFAVSTEALQWFVVTRSSTLPDLAADAAGLALAALTVAAATRITAGVRARRRTRAARGARP